MPIMGGVMRCVDEIRGDGVAPIPVADACLHSQQVTAEHCPPPSHNHDCCALTRVYKATGAAVNVSHSGNRAAGAHQPKNAWGLGRSPKVSTRAARVLFLSSPTTRLIVAAWRRR
jgi:hypothetical protein